jgi:hypothetical protein
VIEGIVEKERCRGRWVEERGEEIQRWRAYMPPTIRAFACYPALMTIKCSYRVQGVEMRVLVKAGAVR